MSYIFLITNTALPGRAYYAQTGIGTPEQRMEEIFGNSKLPGKFEIACSFHFSGPHENLYLHEVGSMVLSELSSYRENDYWFRCPVEHAVSTMERFATDSSFLEKLRHVDEKRTNERNRQQEREEARKRQCQLEYDAKLKIITSRYEYYLAPLSKRKVSLEEQFEKSKSIFNFFAGDAEINAEVSDLAVKIYPWYEAQRIELAFAWWNRLCCLRPEPYNVASLPWALKLKLTNRRAEFDTIIPINVREEMSSIWGALVKIPADWNKTHEQARQLAASNIPELNGEYVQRAIERQSNVCHFAGCDDPFKPR